MIFERLNHNRIIHSFDKKKTGVNITIITVFIQITIVPTEYLNLKEGQNFSVYPLKNPTTI